MKNEKWKTVLELLRHFSFYTFHFSFRLLPPRQPCIGRNACQRKGLTAQRSEINRPAAGPIVWPATDQCVLLVELLERVGCPAMHLVEGGFAQEQDVIKIG